MKKKLLYPNTYKSTEKKPKFKKLTKVFKSKFNSFIEPS